MTRIDPYRSFMVVGAKVRFGIAKRSLNGCDVVDSSYPSPVDMPTGCPFHPRCPLAETVCTMVAPPEKELSPTQVSRCLFAEQRGIVT